MSTSRERLPDEHQPRSEQYHHQDGGRGVYGDRYQQREGYGSDVYGDRQQQRDVYDDRQQQRDGYGGGHWRHEDGRRPHRRPRYNDFRGHRSGVLEWTAAVVFTVLAIVVLLAAVTVLVVVLLLQPRSPYLAVRAASLNSLVYDQQGALDDVQLSLLVEARNANARSAASFSRLELRLAFGGVVLARLRADPFGLPPRGALPLAYAARARGAPLDAARSAAVEAALRDGVVPFGLDGEARTAWKIAGLVGVHHWTRLACELRFFWPNGTALHFSCNSKSKFWFF